MTDLIQRVFEEEIMEVIPWGRRHKLVVFGLVVAVPVTWAVLKYPTLFFALADTISVTYTPLWAALGLTLWLLILSYYAYSSRRAAEQSEFVEDFGHGLDKWEYYGEWRTEREDGRHILSVTESAEGGIARVCLLWRDYDFEFETKIVRGNTTWIIRARDILNYVMLQCGRAELNPHFRVNGMWLKLESEPISPPLPVNTWFSVRIRVQGTRVTARVTVDDSEAEIYNWDLLKPAVKTYTITQDEGTQRADLILSYPVGSVGFREWGSTECAHFRNVRVRKI